MDRQLIIAHDIGTTGNKATLYSSSGELIHSAFFGYETKYPFPEWAEQNPLDWWQAVCETTKQLIQHPNVQKEEIAAVSFSGQMLGCLPVDRHGNPLQDAIIWADMRAREQAAQLEEQLGMEYVYKVTGHRISSSYSGAKIKWIKDNKPDIYKRTYKVLQAKDYLAFKLTGVFATDYSDACGTNCFDIVDKKWATEILKAWELREDIFPEAHPSTDVIGYVTAAAASETGLLEGTPVVIGAGDGVCAAAGVGVMDEGEAFNYIGSSSWVALASNEPVFDPEMKTYTWVHVDSNKYSPNGTMQSGGGSVQWVTNLLYQDISEKYDMMNQEAAQSSVGANQLIYLPYLMGERSPRWNPDARGTFVGLTITHNRGDMARAVMEGVAFNLRIVLETFREADIKVDSMWVLGGGPKSQLWRQILADIYHVQIDVPEYLEEATSMGAAMAGAVGCGAIKDFSEAKKWIKRVESYKPIKENEEKYNALYDLFNEAYEQLVPVFAKLNK